MKRERAGVGGRVRARRAADRALVDARPPCRRARRPASARVRPGIGADAAEAGAAAPASRMSFTSVLLPEPDTPVTQREARRAGTRTSTSLQVVRARPAHLERLRRCPGAASRGHRDRARAGQVLPGERGRDRAAPRPAVPGRDQAAAVAARRRAQVHEVVGRLHGVAVVLHHHHRVAEVAQPRSACRAAAGCRGGGARSTARRGCRARRSAASRSGWRAGCAAPRRPPAFAAARSSVR